MNEFQILPVGTVVRSKAGRDKGQFYLSGECEPPDIVYLYDGKYRKLENPKKKKLKHLATTNTVIPDMESILQAPDQRYNKFIRTALKRFEEKI